MNTQDILDIANKKTLLKDLTNEEIANFCVIANDRYRNGSPIISDEDYDFVFLPELEKRNPNHFLIKAVEPENKGFSENKIRIPEKMLSTDKAYSWDEIEKWLERIIKAANDIFIDVKDIKIKGSAKLDGFAGYDDGKYLYTRGDGVNGSDISRVFARGLGVYNDSSRGQGAGEIVVKKSYFDKNLSGYFEYPRNFQASLIKEKDLDEKAKQAILDKAVFFVPFKQLDSWQGDIDLFTKDFSSIVFQLENGVDFHTDGVVFEIENEKLKRHMGSNRKFHRWQIAFKENKDKAQVEVLGVTAQVGRTGKITPVAELKPTKLSGATINRASAHNYGLVKEQGLGVGSIIELTRSGLVIPKINKVLRPAEVSIPEFCPSCNEKLVWDSDFIICVNHNNCPEQIIGRIAYFFKVLGNNDGFGMASVKRLYENGISKISQVYQLSHTNLVDMGFGSKTAQNLLDELTSSKEKIIEDWRFLAAFGIPRLGMGNCENLLEKKPLATVFNLSVDDIANIEGFADITAKSIISGLESIKEEYDFLIKLGFVLEKTKLKNDLESFKHRFFGKNIVFTGKMSSSRAVLQKQAKSIGINVLTSVNSKTDFLIIGEKVGAAKLSLAKKNNISIIKEEDYLLQINS